MIKYTPEEIAEMEKAGIVFFPNQIESDIIYVDKDGNETEPPEDDTALD